MSHPYGRPIGRAVRLHKDQTIVSVLVDEEKIESAKKAMQKAGPKLGCQIHFRVGTDTKSIGTKPTVVREMIEAKKEEEKTAEGTTETAAEGKGEAKTEGGKKEETKGGKTEAKTEAKGKEAKTEAKGKK
jgi:hypothetical protein